MMALFFREIPGFFSESREWLCILQGEFCLDVTSPDGKSWRQISMISYMDINNEGESDEDFDVA